VQAWVTPTTANYDGIQWYDYDRNAAGDIIRIPSSYGLTGGNFPGPTRAQPLARSRPAHPPASRWR
jgi:hypothetical protein